MGMCDVEKAAMLAGDHGPHHVSGILCVVTDFSDVLDCADQVEGSGGVGHR